MEAELTQWFATLGVGGSLAGLSLYFYQKAVQSHIAREQEHSADWKAEAERRRAEASVWIDVIKGNTAAITLNTEVVRSLAQRLDK